ncbi:MAG: redoxin domain-containing protein, partial [Planctomycetota bacterium]
MLRRFSLCALLAYQLGLASVQPAAANGVIGRHIEDFTLPDYLGREHTLSEVEGDDLIVVAFLGTECPLAKLYAGRLQSLADAYADQGVAFLAVASNVQDSLTEIAAYARRHGIEFPVLKDRGNRVADLLGAERTPEVFLLDRDRTVRYRGRIDDQFVVGI